MQSPGICPHTVPTWWHCSTVPCTPRERNTLTLVSPSYTAVFPSLRRSLCSLSAQTRSRSGCLHGNIQRWSTGSLGSHLSDLKYFSRSSSTIDMRMGMQAVPLNWQTQKYVTISNKKHKTMTFFGNRNGCGTLLVNLLINGTEQNKWSKTKLVIKLKL